MMIYYRTFVSSNSPLFVQLFEHGYKIWTLLIGTYTAKT